MSYKNMMEMAILAAYILESSTDDDDDDDDDDNNNNNNNQIPPQRVRSVWSKNLFLQRSTEGFGAKLLRELRAGEPELYRNILRMSATQFDYLLNLVTPLITKADTNMRTSISAEERLVLTLRYLGSGDSFSSLQYFFRISQPTISRIIPEVLDAIFKVLVTDFIKIPKNEGEWEAVAKRFEEVWQFPNCVGAVDGKHVVMVGPPNAGSVYYNYKGTHSIVLLGVADADYKLLYVDVGRNGKFSDGGVFSHCTFGQALNTNRLHLPVPKPLPNRETAVPFVTVAGDAFAMRPNIMKPYAHRNLTSSERVFNDRLIRTRRIIENVFGIMSARFRVLRKPIHLLPEKTKKVVLACSVLHNFLITTNKEVYAPPNSFDQFDEQGNVTSPGEWRSEATTSTLYPLEPTRDRSDNAKEIQKEFMYYFTGQSPSLGHQSKRPKYTKSKLEITDL